MPIARPFARLLVLALLVLAAAPLAAQYGSDAREACRRAASVLINQEARWDDAGARGLSGTLNWRAADGTYGTCSVDGRGRVYAVRVERWGSISTDVDVWPGSGAGEMVRTLRCESDKERRSTCEIPRGARVRLVDRLSKAQCTFGRTWGYSRHELWVDDGCRAVFEVRW